MTEPLYRRTATGLSLRARVQPRARRAGVLGAVPDVDGPRLKIAVAAPPEDGRANAAVCAAVAEALGVAASAVSVAAGATSRAKLLHVAGTFDALAERIDRL